MSPTGRRKECVNFSTARGGDVPYENDAVHPYLLHVYITTSIFIKPIQEKWRENEGSRFKWCGTTKVSRADLWKKVGGSRGTMIHVGTKWWLWEGHMDSTSSAPPVASTSSLDNWRMGLCRKPKPPTILHYISCCMIVGCLYKTEKQHFTTYPHFIAIYLSQWRWMRQRGRAAGLPGTVGVAYRRPWRARRRPRRSHSRGRIRSRRCPRMGIFSHRIWRFCLRLHRGGKLVRNWVICR